jgi:DNA-directed RNA polymerase specialized sigma24 family protein
MSDTKGATPVDYHDLRRACVEHRAAMVQCCFRILGREDDAEDAAGEAIAKVLRNPPATVEVSLEAFLCGAAKNAAVDILRRKKVRLESKPVPPEPPQDDLLDALRRCETERLLDEIKRYLSEDETQDLDLYLRVARGELSQPELAEELDIPLSKLATRRAKVRTAVHDAAVAVCLIAEPDECAAPADYAKRMPVSPALRRKVRGHVKGCPTCGARKASLRGKFLAIPGTLIVGGLLERMSRLVTAKPVAIAAVATVAVLLALGVFSFDRSPQLSLPAPHTMASTTETTKTVDTTTVSPRPAPVPTTTTTTTQRPPVVAPPPPPPTTTTQGGGGRADEPPSITRTWLEHERIVAVHRTECDKPTTSKVAVHVTAVDGVESVTMIRRSGGETASVSMTNAGNTPIWYGVVGPFQEAGQKVEVSVVAVAKNGARTTTRVGAVCVTSCHRSAEEQRQ